MVVEGLDCKVYNSTFLRILAGDDGGAILWIGQRGLIYNSTFTITNAVGLKGHHSKGGAVNVIGDYSVITKSKFQMTSAAIDGGAIYATGNYINITDSSFNKCNVSHTYEAKYDHGGGAIYVQGNLLGMACSLVILTIFDYASLKRDVLICVGQQKKVLRWVVYVAFVIFIIFNVPITSGQEFIYFQF